MERIEYTCPECGTTDFVTLLGSEEVVFKVKCGSCSTELDLAFDKERKLSVKPTEEISNSSSKKKIFGTDTGELDIEEEISKIKKKDGGRVPDDYPIYDENISVKDLTDKKSEFRKELGQEIKSDVVEFPVSTGKGAVIIAIMILISGILTFSNAWAMAQIENGEGNETPITVVVVNRYWEEILNNRTIENTNIILDGEEIETDIKYNPHYTQDSSEEYNESCDCNDTVVTQTFDYHQWECSINVTTGKHTLEVRNITGYSNVTWNIFVTKTDGETLLGTEGLTEFTFDLREGNGTIEHEPNQIQEMYFSFFKYGPPTLIVFGLISIWGAWMAYKRKSYAGAQIGALFSIFGFGLLFVGPVLGIASLIMLNRNRKLFGTSFNKDNNRQL